MEGLKLISHYAIYLEWYTFWHSHSLATVLCFCLKCGPSGCVTMLPVDCFYLSKWMVEKIIAFKSNCINSWQKMHLVFWANDCLRVFNVIEEAPTERCKEGLSWPTHKYVPFTLWEMSISGVHPSWLHKTWSHGHIRSIIFTSTRRCEMQYCT